ncbi:MAG: TonB-dependent receptor plug domain-containing protein [Nannocystaceae bacterium]|nr:TonB-dependent receptor plug domain-containing protein [bacterium]
MISTFAAMLLAAAPCDEQACANLTLRLRGRGDRHVIRGATVIAIEPPQGAQPGVLAPPPPLPDADPAWQRAAQTDDDGDAVLTDVPTSGARIIVIAAGHARLEAIVVPGQRPTTLFLEPEDQDLFRTVVKSESGPPRARGQSQLLTREEIRTVPGAQGDPLRALQNMPGVARSPFNLGLLVLRGASPSASRVFMGGHALPRAYHVLSLSSVFPAEVLDDLRLVPGNFDAAYGNATGGVVEIEPRAGRRDGLHGFSELDIGAATTMLEGPVGKGSFIVSAQRGYYDLALQTADSVTERVTGDPSGTLYPTYYDYQGMLDYPMRRGSWSLRLFGAGDRLRTPPPAAGLPDRGFDLRSGFHRVDFAVRTRASGWRLWWTPSVRFESGRFFARESTLEQRRRDGVFSMRTELSRRFTPRFSWLVGTDLEVDSYWVRRDIVEASPLVADPDVPRNRGVVSSLGVYTSAPLDLGPVHVTPGARGSAFTVGDEAAFSFDPRVTSTFDVGERWRLHAAVGKYSQVRFSDNDVTVDLANSIEPALWYPPVLSRFDESVAFDPGRQPITVREALHASVGADWHISDSVTAEATAFAREQDNATPLLAETDLVPFASREHTLGVQTMLRRHIGGKLYGWVTYTLMWSQLRFTEQQPGIELRDRPTDFDQRHNFGLVASYILPKRWRIGGRFRVSSGYPFSPVIGSVQNPVTRYPVLGPRNSARLGTFHQLDIRVDKRWLLDRATITGYVDVQNVYNRQNPDAVFYRYDFREPASFVGLPIFPALGVRVDY